MRVLVTGAGGQLGQDLLDAYTGHEVVGLAHSDLDVSREADVVAAVRHHQPEVVVHAAAWTDVDGCEADPDRAHRVNALGAWWTARACRDIGTAMVLVSTDYVFAGEGRDGRHEPYGEFDPVAPLNAYGRSKAAAESLVRQTLREHYIVRTAWLNGAHGGNFVRTMLRVGRESGEASVVDDQRGSPTFTRDLSRAIRELSVSGRFGTYHRTNSGECTWFELAVALYDLAGLDVEVTPISSDQLDRTAPRPSYSVLSNRHAELSGLGALPHWRDGLQRLLSELEGASPDG